MPTIRDVFKALFDEVMVFRVEKTVDIQVWQVGVVFRVCQSIVLAYVITMLVIDSTWAYTEEPAGTVNTWTEAGEYYDLAGLSSYESIPCELAPIAPLQHRPPHVA